MLFQPHLVKIETLEIWKEIVSLPFFPDLEDKKISYIINCLKTFDKKIQLKNKIK